MGEKLPENMSLDASHQNEFNKKVKSYKKKAVALKAAEGDEFLSNNRGVIYVGHIPHGFFEAQMKRYFSQFGKVNKLRISRSKKTGKIKGYAFVEFESDAVAKIVADTMNNYLMFHRLLKCQYLPLTKVHPQTFKGANRKFTKPVAHVIAAQRHNSEKTEKQQKKSDKRMKTRASKSLSKLADMGIDFEFPGLVKVVGKDLTADSEDTSMNISGDRTMDSIYTEAVSVLYDDSTEEEISFSTPPNSVRKKLDKSVVEQEEEEEEADLPVAKKAKVDKVTPKGRGKGAKGKKGLEDSGKINKLKPKRKSQKQRKGKR